MLGSRQSRSTVHLYTVVPGYVQSQCNESIGIQAQEVYEYL